MKKNILILLIIFEFLNFSYTKDLFYTQKKIENNRNLSFDYEVLKTDNKKFNKYVDKVNDYVSNEINQIKEFINTENIDYFGCAMESFIIISGNENYFAFTIVVWDNLGASPYFYRKTFAIDIINDKLVTLSDIIGKNGKEIFNEIVNQYNDNKINDDKDFSYLESDDEFINQLENHSFVFDELRGNIYLLFDKGSPFFDPEFDCYFVPN